MSYITSGTYKVTNLCRFSSRTLCIDLFYSLCLESPGLGKSWRQESKLKRKNWRWRICERRVIISTLNMCTTSNYFTWPVRWRVRCPWGVVVGSSWRSSKTWMTEMSWPFKVSIMKIDESEKLKPKCGYHGELYPIRQTKPVNRVRTRSINLFTFGDVILPKICLHSQVQRWEGLSINRLFQWGNVNSSARPIKER